MQHTEASDRNISHAVRGILKGAGAQLAGRQRGPDHGRDRRVPRRNSYEISDQRAQPWRKVGDGSYAQGVMHREALIDTAIELRRTLRVEYPRAEVRSRRRERDNMAAELAALSDRSPAEVPIGRMASLRIAIGRHDEWLEHADGCLRGIDIDVLRAVLTFIDFATGRLFPSHEAIAAEAQRHKNSVIDALKRLTRHGILAWVRRTIRTGNEGERGPQLEQTSNAYEIAPRRLMAARTWQTYWKRLCAKLRRLGGVPANIEGPTTAPREVSDPALRSALARVDALIPNAST